MGMYDEIFIAESYCPYCGNEMEDKYWQTKSGNCGLIRYESLEEFGQDNRTLGSFEIYHSCDKCKMFIEMIVQNQSSNYAEYMQERTRDFHEWLTGLKKQDSDPG